MADQVPDEVKHERIERLVERRAADRAPSATRRASAASEEVLVEGAEPHRRDAAARPHAPQHDRQLRRQRRGRASSSTS